MSTMLEYALSTMEALDCPRALTLAIMARAGQWRELQQLPVTPSDYADPVRYWEAAQASAFFSKLSCVPGFSPVEREEATIAKWLDDERACARTNVRLNPYWSDPLSEDCEPGIAGFIQRVRKRIKGVIGFSPPTKSFGLFGPGATVSDKSGCTTVPDKLTSDVTLTFSAVGHLLVDWAGTLWGPATVEANRDIRFVRGNRFFTVPKNSRINRPCALEPSLNAYGQRGAGVMLRSLLKRNADIDIQRGQDLHRFLANEASFTGDLATIDLSSASDTMARVLVKLLLPCSWFNYLESLRSPTTTVGDKVYYLEKFSSMGNGFTFELETLIFWALAAEACGSQDYRVSAYGDDIIVPSECYQDVTAVLRFFGFTLNAKKSFATGSFRESCGGDYFNGVDVRPYFPETVPSEPEETIGFLNGLRRSFLSRGKPLVGNLRRRLIASLPTRLRVFGPERLGDLCIHSDRWVTRWRSSGIGYVRVYRPVRARFARVDGFGGDAVLAAACYGALCDRPYRGVTTPIGGLSLDSHRGWSLRGTWGYKLGWASAS